MQKNRLIKGVFNFLSAVVVSTVILMGISIFSEGMYIMGVPPVDEINRVTISFTDTSDKIKDMTDQKYIDLAVRSTGFLRYSLLEKADETNPPEVTVTYFLNDGSTAEVAANDDTVWWKGKAHTIKEKGIFVKMTRAIFNANVTINTKT